MNNIVILQKKTNQSNSSFSFISNQFNKWNISLAVTFPLNFIEEINLLLSSFEARKGNRRNFTINEKKKLANRDFFISLKKVLGQMSDGVVF